MTKADSELHVPVGGDFTNIFDAKTLLSMLNSQDESTVVLKFHLIMEEFINIWCAKTTAVDDLFAGIDFVPFKTKLAIAHNLGLPDAGRKALDKINTIRNRYSHRLKFEASAGDIESLMTLIDNAFPETNVNKCSQSVISSEGSDAMGRRATQRHEWSSGASKQFFLMCVTLTMKLTIWIQNEFKTRGIAYTLSTGLPQDLARPMTVPS
ncbi:hypothetical protein J2X57_000367 [Luteibacter sp. 1214]|uniref:hypothetical protein n=1 Tax=Luteibacter sp. 1214 TaxID=2817735 RepID=UPI00285C285C|nr:hypothetical protein [Luteibacter sp. 1214]MDR6641173.1 hypothetical protein [Luteibacter sp. 1214]